MRSCVRVIIILQKLAISLECMCRLVLVNEVNRDNGIDNVNAILLGDMRGSDRLLS